MDQSERRGAKGLSVHADFVERLGRAGDVQHAVGAAEEDARQRDVTGHLQRRGGVDAQGALGGEMPSFVSLECSAAGPLSCLLLIGVAVLARVE